MKIVLTLFILLAVATVATLWRASVREAATEAAYPPAGQFVEVGGVRVHYVEAGPADAPPLVLIHGSSGNVNDWTFDMMGRLSDRFRVIAMDRPGLGYTDMIGRNASAADQARLLADAATALGAERPLVLGHSYGGAVALAWAVERPEAISGLLVLAGASNPWQGSQGLYYALLGNPVSGPVMAALLSAWVPDATVRDAVGRAFDPQSMPEGYVEHYGAGLILRRFSMLENARQRTSLLPQIEALVPRYPDIAVPTEILHGDADLTVPISVHSEPLSQQIPGAMLTVLDGIGHMPHQMAPEAVVEALDRLAVRAGLR